MGLCMCESRCSFVWMKPFNMKLSDEHRERLEAHRVRLGKRSHADVIRHWIDQDCTAVAKPWAPSGGSGVKPPPATRIEVSIGRPTPAPGSRLKGAKK